MGHDEDIEKLKTDVDKMKESGSIQHKAKEFQPFIWVLVLFIGAVMAWSDLKNMAEHNEREVHRFEDDIKEAKDYTHTKFNELKTILDEYKRKQDSTHDQVLLLKEQNKWTRQEIADNNEILKELLQKINKTGK